MENTEKLPAQLYKILTQEQLNTSTGQHIPRTPNDTAFIHFSKNAAQKDTVIKKYFNDKEAIIIAINPHKVTKGTWKLEPNKDNSDTFWHLYEADVPNEAIVSLETLPHKKEKNK